MGYALDQTERHREPIEGPLRAHGWSTQITYENDRHRFVIMTVERSGMVRRIGVLSTGSIGNDQYRFLDSRVDVIFVETVFHVKEHAYGITTPVDLLDAFPARLLQWNKEAHSREAGAKRELDPLLRLLAWMRDPEAPASSPAISDKEGDIELLSEVVDSEDPAGVMNIESEQPLQHIWSRLRSLESVTLARRMLLRRAEAAASSFPDLELESRSSGVAYTVRTANDYFGSLGSVSLSQRILNMYYGTLALASAEMLARPGSSKKDMAAIEEATKNAHGLITLEGSTNGFDDLVVVPRQSGFFASWLKVLGLPRRGFLSEKPPKELGGLERDTPRASLAEIFGRFPELSELYEEVFPDVPPRWMNPRYDENANPRRVVLRRGGVQTPPRATYIRLSAPHGRLDPSLPERLDCGLEQLGLVPGAPGEVRALVPHPQHRYWHQALPLHGSPESPDSALIEPLFGSVREFRLLAFVLLYALSILVRYRPSVWRRVQEGDLDHFRTITEVFLDVAQRVLPQRFLQTITGRGVRTRLPGGLF